MRILLLLLMAFGALGNVAAEHLDLDQLLRDVKKSQGIEGKINQQREGRFLQQKNQQQQLLAEAQAQLAKQEQNSKQLKSRLEANELELSKLEAELNERSAGLGELFGVARQAAADLQADLDQSLISAQFPKRSEQLEVIANSKALPTIAQLETLWFTLQQQMTEAGKVVRYRSEILSAAGEPKSADVIRVGPFDAIADDLYLRYLSETGQLAELSRQPETVYLDIAEQFTETKQGLADMVIDPTRGVLLGLLIQTPDTIERIKQGGIVGYIILLLGVCGFIYAIIRLIMLAITDRKMERQMNDLGHAASNNPLGRVLLAAEQGKTQDMETLQLILDEAITREVPKLEKGQSMIKLLAAVAPLLGLLGTVTGMITTFQSISLFGTGDPKLMASGISQALVTTMLGLVVAIPLLFLHSLVVSRSSRLVQILDEQTAGLINRRAEH